MNPIIWRLAVIAAALPFSVRAQALDLRHAIDLAVATSPEVRTATAEVEVARRRVTTSSVSEHRPELGVSAGPRIGFDGTVGPDVSMSFSKTIELGDKAAHREAVAAAELSKREASLDEVRVRVAAEVAEIWASWASAVDRRNRLEALLSDARAIEQKLAAQVKTGVSTRVQGGSARMTVARAEAERDAADAEAAIWAAELAVLVPVPSDGPDLSPLALPAMEGDWSADAVRRRGRVRAALSAVETARARAALARAETTSDLTLGAFVALEGEEVAAGLTFAFPWPGNPRATAEALAHDAAAEAAEERAVATGQAVRRTLVRIRATADQQSRRADVLRERVATLMGETSAQLGAALREGQVTAVDVLLALREARELTMAQADAEAAARGAVALLIAIGGAP